MRILHHVSLLLLMAVGGALAITGTAMCQYWKLDQVRRTTGHASEDYQRVRKLVADGGEWLSTMDIVNLDSGGVTL